MTSPKGGARSFLILFLENLRIKDSLRALLYDMQSSAIVLCLHHVKYDQRRFLRAVERRLGRDTHLLSRSVMQQPDSYRTHRFHF